MHFDVRIWQGGSSIYFQHRTWKPCSVSQQEVIGVSGAVTGAASLLNAVHPRLCFN